VIAAVTMLCATCRESTTGRLHFNSRMQLVDTDGGMLFDAGWKCHNCLGEPWSSADMVIGPFTSHRGPAPGDEAGEPVIGDTSPADDPGPAPPAGPGSPEFATCPVCGTRVQHAAFT
jgi:hypothetical protein